MDAKRRTAKKYLIDACRSEYEEVTHEAKLTPRQQRILDLALIENMRYWEIAEAIGNCQEVIKIDLQRAYDKIYNVIV